MTDVCGRHIWLITFLSLMPVIVLLAVTSGGVGFGDYPGARVLLPLACGAMGTYPGSTLVVTTLALAEWPLYGLALDYVRPKVVGFVGLVVVHGLLCFWVFSRAGG